MQATLADAVSFLNKLSAPLCRFGVVSLLLCGLLNPNPAAAQAATTTPSSGATATSDKTVLDALALLANKDDQMLTRCNKLEDDLREARKKLSENCAPFGTKGLEACAEAARKCRACQGDEDECETDYNPVTEFTQFANRLGGISVPTAPIVKPGACKIVDRDEAKEIKDDNDKRQEDLQDAREKVTELAPKKTEIENDYETAKDDLKARAAKLKADTETALEKVARDLREDSAAQKNSLTNEINKAELQILELDAQIRDLELKINQLPLEHEQRMLENSQICLEAAEAERARLREQRDQRLANGVQSANSAGGLFKSVGKPFLNELGERTQQYYKACLRGHKEIPQAGQYQNAKAASLAANRAAEEQLALQIQGLKERRRLARKQIEDLIQAMEVADANLKQNYVEGLRSLERSLATQTEALQNAEQAEYRKYVTAMTNYNAQTQSAQERLQQAQMQFSEANALYLAINCRKGAMICEDNADEKIAKAFSGQSEIDELLDLKKSNKCEAIQGKAVEAILETGKK